MDKFRKFCIMALILSQQFIFLSLGGQEKGGDNAFNQYMSTFPTNENGEYVNEDGEVLDWDFSGFSGEDSAGLENQNTASENQETMSFSEAVQNQQIIESAKASDASDTPSEVGTITIFFYDNPDFDWSRNNIKVVLWRNKNQKEEIYLYKQNDFYTTKSIPIGEYTFEKGESLDKDFFFSSDTGSFEISQDKPTMIELHFGKSAPEITLSEELNGLQESQENLISQKNAKLENQQRKTSNKIRIFIFVCIVLLIGFVFIFIRAERKKMKEREGLID